MWLLRALMLNAIPFVVIGLWFFLIGLGKINVSKNPEVNARFLQECGRYFRFAGPVLVLIGIVLFLAALS